MGQVTIELYNLKMLLIQRASSILTYMLICKTDLEISRSLINLFLKDFSCFQDTNPSQLLHLYNSYIKLENWTKCFPTLSRQAPDYQIRSWKEENQQGKSLISLAFCTDTLSDHGAKHRYLTEVRRQTGGGETKVAGI